jgi:hypothetical protein
VVLEVKYIGGRRNPVFNGIQQLPSGIRGIVMLGALFLGLFCGIVACVLVPGDMSRDMSRPSRAARAYISTAMMAGLRP